MNGTASAVQSERLDEVASAACEIRVLENIPDLIESFRLRYEVYGGLGYVRHTRSQLEIDGYDPYAIPFGAFEPSTGELIGTLRLIKTDVQAGYVQAVCQILAQAGDERLMDMAVQPRKHLLPSIITGEVGARLAAYNTQRYPIAELSRTIVRPGYRGAGVSRGLMEFGLAYAAIRTPGVLIGGCLEMHLPMYARYGYVQLPQTELDFFDSVGQVAHAVVCRTDLLPQPTQGHVEQLLPRLPRAAKRSLGIQPLPAVYRLARDGDRLRPMEGN